MAIDNTITISGNTTREPELRFTPAGKPVANFSVAVNRRWTNQDGTQEEAVTFIDVTAWGDLAENTATTVSKGSRVVVVGRLDQKTWQTDTGENRSRHEITASDIAPSLKWATATITKTTNDQNQPPTTTTTRPPETPTPVLAGAQQRHDEEPF